MKIALHSFLILFKIAPRMRVNRESLNFTFMGWNELENLNGIDFKI